MKSLKFQNHSYYRKNFYIKKIDKRKIFELYRNELKNIEVVCFDELLEKIDLLIKIFDA